MITPEEVKSASTSQLQVYYAQLVGKPTTNRNKSALTARVLALVAAHRPPKVKRAAKPSKASTKPVRVVYLPGEKPLPKVKIGKRYARNATRVSLADLPAGTILYHQFRAGSSQAAKCGERIEVAVLQSCAKDGTGGRYEYRPSKGQKRMIEGLKGLRALVLETAGCAVNLLMFFRRADTDKQLAPWPKHAKKPSKRDGLTEAQKEYVRTATRADLEREQATKGKRKKQGT